MQAPGFDLKSTVETIGIGGFFAILVLREVFTFLRSQRNGNGKNGSHNSGTLPPEFWLEQFEKNRAATVEAINAAMQPVAQGFVRMEGTLGEIRDNTLTLRIWSEVKERGKGIGTS